ncbi:alpha/beta fold hydrolase [Pedobacter sp. SYSU D00535]|uniref:alpha/beta fold hydrolase n=1 Tax=Pedobacter sp. SYSU D00535 TaxID=2810308 RepID=UPI001A974B37|nr:alpha/beta hydrolase [Pedobacter sp. SYSU D00535]
MIEEKQVLVDSLNVSYFAKTAVNPKLTAVFIHGFPFNKAIWRAQLEGLPEDVSGVAYDIRGFGSSEAGHQFFSIDLFARDLLNLLEVLHIERPLLCGISMGGYIALRAAEIALQKLGGLVLADTNAVADSEEGKLRRFATIDQVLSDGRQAFADNFVKNVFSPRSFSDLPEQIAAVKQMIESTEVSTICSSLLALASRTSTLEFLPAIDVPVLVIRGEEDKLMTEEHLNQLGEHVRNAEVELIPEAAHLPNIESPEIFNFYLNRFISKHF